MPFDRRSFHRAALGLALASWGVRPVQAAAPMAWRDDPFTLGVASGQPRPDRVVLWTRLLPGCAEESQRCAAAGAFDVQWQVFADAALRRPVAQGQVRTDAARGFSVHAQVAGLGPEREYWYRFTCGSAASPVGRTRTAPAPDAAVKQLRFALASCQNYEHGYYAAHREIADGDFDFVMFVGDYIYEGSNPALAVRRHDGPTPHDLDGYRARHALYKRDADLQAAHAAHPWLLCWDDHEVENDYAGEHDPGHGDPARFLRRRAAAYQAYFEHMPLALPPQGAAMRIHDHFAWGQLADLWMLDCRQHRSSHACPDPARDVGRIVIDCPELAQPSRTVLGVAQERWLAEQWTRSRARWRLLGQTTQLSSTGFQTPEGRRVWTDGWDGYPAARQRLVDGASEGGRRNAVFLGGDVHRHLAAGLRARPNDVDSPLLASEFVGGSISSRGAGRAAMARMRRDNPDILHARGDERGYAIVRVSADLTECEFRATAFPVTPAAAFHAQARFVVEAGRPGPQAA